MQQHIAVTFHEKSLITLQILNHIWYQDVPYVYPILVELKFKGNLMRQLCFMTVSCKCVKRGKKQRK